MLVVLLDLAMIFLGEHCLNRAQWQQYSHHDSLYFFRIMSDFFLSQHLSVNQIFALFSCFLCGTLSSVFSGSSWADCWTVCSVFIVSGLFIASRQPGTAQCTTRCSWTELLRMGRRSTWPSLLTWRYSVLCAQSGMSFFYLGSITPPLVADGKLHPTCRYYQRRLHGVSLPRRKALGLPFYSEPLWHRKLEGTWWVSVQHHSLSWVQKVLTRKCWTSFSISNSNLYWGFLSHPHCSTLILK